MSQKKFKKTVTNLYFTLSGMRLFLNATLAVILLQLSGDVETNPGPQFEMKECRTRGLKAKFRELRNSVNNQIKQAKSKYYI